ncbi:hypothetical protein P797_08215 [Pseudomonas aeruginosa VRFPA04]|nr:hypothetical protein P797_08215 [Pseudomonas aeruginosa VRFPA04]
MLFSRALMSAGGKGAFAGLAGAAWRLPTAKASSRHHFIRVWRGQRHANLPKLATLQQREALAFGQADDVRWLDHRHAGHADAILGV